MDRKGIYRKGREGHARTVNMYRLYKQNHKKWRLPVTLVLTLVLIFGTAPMVGDQFQASLLTNGDTAEFINSNPQQARKVFLNNLYDFVKDCEKFKLDSCVSRGKELINQVASTKNDLMTLLPAIENLEDDFEEKIAESACKYDLSKALGDAVKARESMQKFSMRYGDSFEDLESVSLTDAFSKLDSGISSLESFVEYCRSR